MSSLILSSSPVFAAQSRYCVLATFISLCMDPAAFLLAEISLLAHLLAATLARGLGLPAGHQPPQAEGEPPRGGPGVDGVTHVNSAGNFQSLCRRDPPQCVPLRRQVGVPLSDDQALIVVIQSLLHDIPRHVDVVPSLVLLLLVQQQDNPLVHHVAQGHQRVAEQHVVTALLGKLEVLLVKLQGGARPLLLGAELVVNVAQVGKQPRGKDGVLGCGEELLGLVGVLIRLLVILPGELDVAKGSVGPGYIVLDPQVLGDR
mmetsp:Transcript_2840/g.10523  ORF Transcript_2840/g.10523 Transcript_2840/m.10523 type:complete len:259 (-) Transcript_2840:785-1561(-)